MMAAPAAPMPIRQVFDSALDIPAGVIFPLSLAATMFAMQQTGLGFLDYLPVIVTRVLQAVLAGSVLLLACIGFIELGRLPRYYRRVVVGLAGLNVFHLALSLAFGGVRPIFPFESALMAFAMVPILQDSRLWLRLMRWTFALFMVLIALNSVTLLHWGGWIDLSHEYIPRLVDTGEDLSHHDPFSFGIFGRTENQPVAGTDYARLQGWSLEPLHWGYFAVLSMALGLMLRSVAVRLRARWGYMLCVIAIFAHLTFVNSSSVDFTIAGTIGSAFVLFLVRNIRRLEPKAGGILFLVMTLGTGFVIPFGLAFIPDIDYWFEVEDVTGEAGNWSGKVGFLFLGAALFTRFLPVTQPVEASHNLVLSTYLHYGYFLTAPLLVFLYWLARSGAKHVPFGVGVATIIVALSHMLLVPSAMFYPGGVFFFVLVFATAYYHRTAAAHAAPAQAPAPAPAPA